MQPLRRLLPFVFAALLPAAVSAAPLDGDALKSAPWSEVVAAAKGQVVDFFLWGGDDRINAYVSKWLGDRLKKDYDITLNRVGLTSTAEAVNQVLSEKEAGITAGGAVDLVWINGENFRTLKENGLLFCGYRRGCRARPSSIGRIRRSRPISARPWMAARCPGAARNSPSRPTRPACLRRHAPFPR